MCFQYSRGLGLYGGYGKENGIYYNEMGYWGATTIITLLLFFNYMGGASESDSLATSWGLRHKAHKPRQIKVSTGLRPKVLSPRRCKIEGWLNDVTLHT